MTVMLPEKKNLKNNDDIVLFRELSEVQKELYKHILALPDFFSLSTSSTPCDCEVNFRNAKR